MKNMILPKLSLFVSVQILLFCGIWSSLAAAPTIYRCGPAGSQWYSQIPCEENSEQVIVEDHPMFNETGEAQASTEESQDSGADDDADSASNAQAFITQLEKQRREQLAEIDRDIKQLQTRAEEAAGKDASGEDGDSADAEETAILLASLQDTRLSIVSEYDAMISAARQSTETP